MSFDIGATGYLLASACLLFLLLAQLKIWKSGNSSFVLLIATAITLVWSTSLAFQAQFSVESFYLIPLLEILKNIAWFTLLLSILGVRRLIFSRFQEFEGQQGLAVVSAVALGIPFALAFLLFWVRFVQGTIIFFPAFGGQWFLIGFLLSAVVGLALLEQVIRNTRHHHRWHIKFLCLGLGILFSYDVYLYSNATLFDNIQPYLWQIRGGIIVLATPFIAIGVLRTRAQPIQLNISRRLVFHSGVLVAAGAYLVLMASAGFYIREFSGEWGPVLQVMFWVFSLSMLLVLIYSGRLRSILKNYINRHLFSSKYDYRDEWMQISSTLSDSSSSESLPDRVILALAAIVDSPAGGLWLTTNGSHYDQVAQIEMGWFEGVLKADDELIEHIQSHNKLIDLSDENAGFDLAVIPEWLLNIKEAWLIVPLQLDEKLLGFVLLRNSRVEYELNWEDYDLLKAAGQQAASYLAQMIASDTLTETRQFAAFNQVSAFVVHDIKTLNSQLSLMVGNAEKFKSNPEFVEDMIKTTDHAVTKMGVLLKHFKMDDGSKSGGIEGVDLVNMLQQIIASKTTLSPLPSFSTKEDELWVKAIDVELKSSLGHLIQNAQEATDDDGSVDVVLSSTETQALITISDTGTGMTPEFIKTRLFRPFDSTKGLTGMGIGVFQSRDSIRKFGGDIVVKSELNVGSEFLVTLPLTLKDQLDQTEG